MGKVSKTTDDEFKAQMDTGIVDMIRQKGGCFYDVVPGGGGNVIVLTAGADPVCMIQIAKAQSIGLVNWYHHH